MDCIKIRGGIPLKGTIEVSGAKNAALPLMAASLLCSETLTLTNLPQLADIITLEKLLSHHGVEVNKVCDPKKLGCEIDLKADNITDLTAPYDLVRLMRASVLVLGPLLSRFGEAKVSLPGGCAIGTRPVDMHLTALEQMGAKIEIKKGFIDAKVDGRLKGAEIIFPHVTVGGTENIVMAACLADGKTIIKNAAKEPEITDLCECLVKMGAKIDGIDTDTLTITGVEKLHSAKHKILADRIEAGTFAIAAAITRGKLDITGIDINLLTAVIAKLREAGVRVKEIENGFRVDSIGRPVLGVDVMTEPYPGFPTDMQAQFMALMCTCKGASLVTETIFENRFMHVPELSRTGANINIHGHSSAIIRGIEKLSAAPLMATDLRASVSLVLAGLAAKGETTVRRIYHLDRGYEKLEEKLAGVGADIRREKDTPEE